jgi:Protein of unknown function (DUF4232)
MTLASPPVRRAAAAAVLACAGAAITSCGAGSPAATPTVTVTKTVTRTAPPSGHASTSSSAQATSPAGSSGPQPCATSALKATIGPAEGAAGSSYYPIDFTSNASASCTLFGYPGVSFVTGQGGGQIGAAAVRDSVTAPALVTVAPGAIAHATLQVVNASNYPASRCTITKAHWLRVYPPDQFTALYISFSAPTCAGGATATPILSIQAVKPGATGQ